MNDIAVTAYSSFGATSFVELGVPASESPLTLPSILEIGARHSKSAAQVLLRWGVQRGTAVIPKSSKVERLIENASIFDWELTVEDMAAIDALNQNKRYNDPGVYAEAAFGCFCPIFD